MPEKKRNIVKIMSLVFLVIAAVGIGVTGASISHRMELTNQIRTPTVSVEVREEVGSVEEGLKTKKVKFENTGNADVFLRVSYGETWTYQEGEQRMILPNEPEGKEAAVKKLEYRRKLAGGRRWLVLLYKGFKTEGKYAIYTDGRRF